MEMETEYRFGFGKIGQVLRGEVDKTDSLDELEVEDPESKILVPKIIGVYQEYTDLRAEKILDKMTQLETFFITGRPETVSEELICVAYDPTIIPGDMLRQTLDGDVLGRLKVIEYCSWEGFPEFDEKHCPDPDIVRKTHYDPSESNISLLERSKNYLELLRQDYGLTRLEALGLEASKQLLINLGKIPDVVNNPQLIKKVSEEHMDMLKGFDFKSFLRRERFFRND